MILRFSAHMLLALLATDSTAAWVSPSRHVLPRNAILKTKITYSSPLYSSPPDDDDELCGDDEECEIDWSQMPDFDDGNEKQLEAEEASLKAALSQLEREFQLECLTETEDRPQQERVPTMSQVRLRLEMNWELEETKDECDVERVQTCAHACQDCGGTGYTECRFCRGTAVLWMGPSVRPCTICQKGVEVCSHCRGSGWVASWTDLQGLAP